MAKRSAGNPSPAWVVSTDLFKSEDEYFEYLHWLRIDCLSTEHLFQPIDRKQAWQPPDGYSFDHHSSQRLSVFLTADRPPSSDAARPLAHDTLFVNPPSMAPPISIEAVPYDEDFGTMVLSRPWTSDSAIWTDDQSPRSDEVLAEMTAALEQLDQVQGDELLETLDVIHFNSSLWVLDPDTSPILSPYELVERRLEASGTATSQWWEWYVAQNVICQMRRETKERARAEELLGGWTGSAWELFVDVQKSTGSAEMLEVLVHCPEPVWIALPDEFEEPR